MSTLKKAALVTVMIGGLAALSASAASALPVSKLSGITATQSDQVRWHHRYWRGRHYGWHRWGYYRPYRYYRPWGYYHPWHPFFW